MDSKLFDYSLKRICSDNAVIINRVVDNLDVTLLKPLKATPEFISYNETQALETIYMRRKTLPILQTK